MPANLVIKAQPGSSAFVKRTIIVEPGGRVAVSRASKDNRPRSDNAVFECRVRRESVLVESETNKTRYWDHWIKSNTIAQGTTRTQQNILESVYKLSQSRSRDWVAL